MKKILVLSLILVFAFSLSALATGNGCTPDDPDYPLCGDSVDMKIKVNDYCEADIFTPDAWKGLFGRGTDQGIGAPGLYITDGQISSTDITDPTDGIWKDVLAASPNDYSYDPADILFNPGDEGAEVFSVDANTKVKVTISADWDQPDKWLNAPTLLMVYSDANWGGGDHVDFNGIGSFNNMLAYLANPVSTPNNEDYKLMIEKHNDLLDDNREFFVLDFPNDYLCQGPLDFTINGALLIPKISQVAAGDYLTTVSITVAPTE